MRMKLIDFHTHFFPDEIAAETVKYLEDNCGIKALGDGRLASQIENMDREGIDISVNAPIATKSSQVEGINRKMIEFNAAQKRVISFGTLHPGYENADEEARFLAENGVKGIKMHPEYQSFYPDDGKMKKIYSACIRHNLILLFHSGADAAFDIRDTHGTPKRMARVIDSNRGLKLVLAHLGGFRMWDNVFRLLAGKDVYFDTSLIDEASDSAVKGIIEAHGTDKILFGSDYPWGPPLGTKQRIERFVENEADREKIFYKNAERVMGTA